MDKSACITINNLNEFLDWVEEEKIKTNNPAGNTRGLFYRGHSDESYQLKPSVYRENENGQSYREVEHHLYQEMLRSEVSAFINDKTIFERLIRMQHHGLPTRLLDVTEDPLVALYFACKNKFSKDGQVIFFNVDPLSVMFSPTIPNTAFVGLEKPLSVLQMGMSILEQFINYLENRKNDRSNDSDFDIEYHALLDRVINYKNFRLIQKDIQDILLISTILYNIENDIEIFFEKWNTKFEEKDNELKTVGVLEQVVLNLRDYAFLSKFRNEINATMDLIVKNWSEQLGIPYINEGSLSKFLRQFAYFYFVYPPKNNERIQRQKGAFLIYPQIESEHLNPNEFYKPSMVIIKGECKQLILSQLSNIGITENYLFPSLDERANEIKKQYWRSVSKNI